MSQPAKEQQSMENHKPATILPVEDDPVHALLIEKNLRLGGIANDIITPDNRQKAVDFLFKKGDYSGDDHSALPPILFDLNLPAGDGFQVPAVLKKDGRARQVPLAAPTTTDIPREASRCCEFGGNVSRTKPGGYDKFSDAMRTPGLFFPVFNVPGLTPENEPGRGIGRSLIAVT
jgi:CheY-like chemotaxis protein